MEYSDHNEVVCEGDAKPAQAEKNTDTNRVEILKSKINTLKNEFKFVSNRTGKETDVEISQIISERLRIAKEITAYEIEMAELTIKDSKLLEAEKTAIYKEYEMFDKSSDRARASYYTESQPKIKISDINALEVRRGISYAYYSVRAEADNLTDKPVKGSFVLQAKNYDDHVVESVTFYFNLNKKETRMLAEEKMISLDLVPVIRKWEVDKLVVK